MSVRNKQSSQRFSQCCSAIQRSVLYNRRSPGLNIKSDEESESLEGGLFLKYTKQLVNLKQFLCNIDYNIYKRKVYFKKRFFFF